MGIEQKCVWKEILEMNNKGLGTSFDNRTEEDLKCYNCDGYNRMMNCYNPSDPLDKEIIERDKNELGRQSYKTIK